MKFKMKALVAAVAMASSFGASAAMSNFTAAGPGSLIFTLWSEENAVSAMFDLGFGTDNFTYANTGAAGTTITWNFNTGTVTGSSNVAALVSGVSGSWADAWNDYAPALASSTYAVFAGDRTGTATTQQYYLSTSTSDMDTEIALTTNSHLIQFNTVNNNVLANSQLGNHASVANGANLSAGAGSYNGAAGGFGSNWNGKALAFNAVGTLDQQLSFYSLQGVAGGTNTEAAVAFAGAFNFNAASGELVYTAVPEPEQFAMLLAGLGMIGAIARRRLGK